MDVWWLYGRFLLSDPANGRLSDASLPRPASAPVSAHLPRAAVEALEADPVLTRTQAAAFLRVASATLAEWATARKGPPFFDYGREVATLSRVSWSGAEVS